MRMVVEPQKCNAGLVRHYLLKFFIDEKEYCYGFRKNYPMQRNLHVTIREAAPTQMRPFPVAEVGSG
jgi:hypothetical protein